MNRDDLTIEVRDKTLARLGQIVPDKLNFTYTGVHNGVGQWTLTLPIEHELTEALLTPGSGIIIVGSDGVEIDSGPMVSPEFAESAGDPAGTVTFVGVTDNIVFSDRLAWPQPDNGDWTTQNTDKDTREAAVETLMHQFVNHNIGPLAPAARRVAGLTMGADGAHGDTVKKSASFDQLGALLADLAATANLGFRIIQRGTGLKFETFVVADKTGFIRLDVENNTLAEQKLSTAPPGVTRALVAGSDDAGTRVYLDVSTADSRAAEVDWGRRIEQFVDQRSTEDVAELQQAGDELMAQNGSSTLTITATPQEDAGNMVYGKDWTMGDKITVVVNGEEFKAVASGSVIKCDEQGFRLGVVVGEISRRTDSSALIARVTDLGSRVSSLEKALPQTPPPVAVVTSTTRPSNPRVGDEIFEEDTGKSYVWAGSWVVTSSAGLDTAWQTATLTGGWTHFSPGDGVDRSVQYRIKNGCLELRGQAVPGSYASVIFTLPVGYRPQRPYPSMLAYAHNNGVCSIDVLGGGSVTATMRGDGTGGAAYVSFNGLAPLALD